MVINVSISEHVEESTKINSTLVQFKNFAKSTKNWIGIIGLLFTALLLSPIFILVSLILLYKIKHINREVKTLKPALLEEIKKSSFKNLNELENKMTELAKHTRVTSGMKKINIPIWNKIILNMEEIHFSFKEVISSCESRYYTNQSELQVSESDLEKYHNQFKEFNDLWDYEENTVTKEYLFNKKKGLVQN